MKFIIKIIIFIMLSFFMANKSHSQSVIISNALTYGVVQKEFTLFWDTNVPTKTVIYLGTNSTNLIAYCQNDTFKIKHNIRIHNLNPGTHYYYKIKSISASGTFKNSLLLNTITGGKIEALDTIAPSVPKNLIAYLVKPTEFTLQWDSCTDNTKIAGYIIWGRKGLITKTKTAKNSIVIKTMLPNTLYLNDFGAQMSFSVQAYDTTGNISWASEKLIVQTPDTSLLYPILSRDTNLFSYKINPTENPIGGGWGYKNTVNILNATHIVYNKNTLKNALSTAKNGEIIYILDTCKIDLTNEFLLIPKGVTLASGRGNGASEGALLYSNSLTAELEFRALLETGGDSVTITGLRLMGPNPDIWDHDYKSRGVANAIYSKNAYTHIHNCEIFGWDKWAIRLYISKGAHIHHNYLHHSIRAGYGYHVWCGGAGSEVGSVATIEANLFEAGRHCIASSGHRNSWEARYNVFLRRQLFINLDRHDYGSTNVGGRSIAVQYNYFVSTQQHYGFAPTIDSLGKIEISYNYFRRDSAIAGEVKLAPSSSNVLDKINIHDNYYNREGISVPKSIIYSDKTIGKAPLTVKFDGSGSYDINGIPITKYVWRFGDGDFRGNEIRSKNVTYVFNTPGVYNVTLIAYNAFGVPGDAEQKTITVYPPLNINQYILSAWIKDTYPGELSGHYSKQILFDGQVIWSDDVAGNEGWQHIILDISPFGTAGSKHKISFRLYAVSGVSDYKTQICELYMWIDDVTVFNGTIENSGFEDGESIAPWKQTFGIPLGSPTVSSALTTEDCRSGEKSFRLRFPYGQNIPAGTWGECYQYTTFK